MSGPIVRKYGFPNHDQIFGGKPLQHGVEDGEGEESATESGSAPAPEKAPSGKAKPKSSKAKTKKG